MDWTVVADWIINHGYACSDWECIEITDCSVYLADKTENTFISVFENGGRVVVFVGSLAPRISAGGDTDWTCESPWDAIDYLKDHMEGLWETLNIKMMEHYMKGCD
jgi:hypothetical protein